MKKLIQLFNEIHLIIEKHEYIRKEKGDNYNLFKVINMTSDETKKTKKNKNKIFLSSLITITIKLIHYKIKKY